MLRNTLATVLAMARVARPGWGRAGATPRRTFAVSRPTLEAAAQTSGELLKLLKFDSGASRNLYAIFKLHNMPYLVTKGDKVVLPFKLKNVEVGDQLVLNNVTTLGSPNFTYNEQTGVASDLYELTANVVEITREPYYEVYRKKQRCRRLKTFPVQNFQTILLINELRLK